MAMVAPVKKANTKAVKIKSLRIAFPLRCLGTVKVAASMCSASGNPMLIAMLLPRRKRSRIRRMIRATLCSRHSELRITLTNPGDGAPAAATDVQYPAYGYGPYADRPYGYPYGSYAVQRGRS
jgi:hypothetical protein